MLKVSLWFAIPAPFSNVDDNRGPGGDIAIPDPTRHLHVRFYQSSLSNSDS